jgi:hypothetical protein
MRVTMSISADWPLEADGPEAILLATERLKKLVGDAGLVGDSLTTSYIPATRVPTTVGLAYGYGAPASRLVAVPYLSPGSGPVPPGPQLLYVARISPAQREAAIAEAFVKAKTTAAELAKAAGGQRGPIVQISSFTGVGIASAPETT